MTDLGDDRRFWGIGEVLRLSWPASLTMLNGTIMQFVDGLMVSRLIGRQALSAQFVAGILSFVPISLAMGVCSVINTFVSQNLGAGRPRMCAVHVERPVSRGGLRRAAGAAGGMRGGCSGAWRK